MEPQLIKSGGRRDFSLCWNAVCDVGNTVRQCLGKAYRSKRDQHRRRPTQVQRHCHVNPFSTRTESFGTIVQTLRPRALFFLGGSPYTHKGLLSAPLEAHLQLTNRCDAGCTGCYTNATPASSSTQRASPEWGLDEWKRALDVLAEMRVFHVALGGGESADLPWLPEIARYARAIGIIPNLTTSGLSNLGRVLQSAHLFGQINVSIDGLADTYKKVRGFDGFAQADYAIRELRKVTKHVGINVVVTTHNFSELSAIVKYGEKRRLNEIELLRFKPSGRGSRAYEQQKLSRQQQRELYPLLRRLSLRALLRLGRTPRIRTDCSMFPLFTEHRPPVETLHKLGMFGCTAGDFLMGAKANGAVSGCSFLPAAPGRPKLTELKKYWNQDTAFSETRSWESLPAPCSSCEYQRLCRGGCRAVSMYYTGDARSPDPECTRVISTQGERVPPQKTTVGSPQRRLPVLVP